MDTGFCPYSTIFYRTFLCSYFKIFFHFVQVNLNFSFWGRLYLFFEVPTIHVQGGGGEPPLMVRFLNTATLENFQKS